MRPDQDRDHAKRHAPGGLHPILDAVYDFAMRHDGKFESRPISNWTWGAYWETASICRIIWVTVYDDLKPGEIHISPGAWRDDEASHQRYYTGVPSWRVLPVTVDIPRLEASLEEAFEEAMALTQQDLTQVSNLQGPVSA
jgi:hypothetical protein